VNAVTAISSRISAIEGRIADVSGRAGAPGFAELLRTADQRLGDAPPGSAPHAASQVGPAGSPGNGLAGFGAAMGFDLVGMMGTPILRTGWRGTPIPTEFTTPPGDWYEALPARGRQWAGAIEDAATRAGIDPRLLAALVWGESEFTPDAVSHAGAIGLTQLMPATAAGLGVEPTDPIANLNGGARYLADMLGEFGSLELGLAAYNAGPGAVRRAGGIPAIPETQAYVPKVLGYYRMLGGLA
jgi:hypothetical protein